MTQAVLAAIVVLLLNLRSLALFGWDKRQARRHGRRVSERRLLWSAALGGSLGAKAAQRLFRHKTKKQPFARRLSLILAGQAVILLASGGALMLPERSRAVFQGGVSLAEDVSDRLRNLVAEPDQDVSAPERRTVKVNRGL